MWKNTRKIPIIQFIKKILERKFNFRGTAKIVWSTLKDNNFYSNNDKFIKEHKQMDHMYSN